MVADLFVMLFLITMVLFKVYHFYIDYKNWSNTGNTFAEGMTNKKKISVDVSGRYGRESRVLPCTPGYVTMTESIDHGASGNCEGKDRCEIHINDKCQVSVGMRDRCLNKTNNPVRNTFSEYANPGQEVEKDQCKMKYVVSTETVSGTKEDGYRGIQNKTTQGKTCQKWSSQRYQKHSRTPNNIKFKDKGLGDHNYCRNPDGEPGGIWCYTTQTGEREGEDRIRWQYCDPLPPQALDCQGSWSECGTGCTQSFTITQNAENGGAQCSAKNGASRSCTGGQCPPPTTSRTTTLSQQNNLGEIPMISRGWKPNFTPPSTRGGSSVKLGKGEGDCDKGKNQCLDGLKCGLRSGHQKIQGLSGKGIRGMDYCYDPNWKPLQFKNPQPQFNQLEKPIQDNQRLPPGTQLRPGGAVNSQAKWNQMGRAMLMMLTSKIKSGEMPPPPQGSDWEQQLRTIGPIPPYKQHPSGRPAPTPQQVMMVYGMFTSQVSRDLGQKIKRGEIPPPPPDSFWDKKLKASGEIVNTEQSQQLNQQFDQQVAVNQLSNAQQLSSQPNNNALFNEQIMQQVLAGKNLIPSDIKLSQENQGNFIRVGKVFMKDLSYIRNLAIPNIDNDDYESLGRVIAKIKIQEKEKITGPQNIVAKQQLVNSINNILSGTSISNSQVNWETPKNSSKTTTTGMYGDNSNSMMGYGDKATKNHSRLIQKKDGSVGEPDGGLCMWKGCEKHPKRKPYDSVWSLY